VTITKELRSYTQSHSSKSFAVKHLLTIKRQYKASKTGELLPTIVRRSHSS